LEPLIKQLDIAGKMASHMNELKSMFSGAATKEAGALTQLEARLAQLEGDAPAVTLSPDVEAALKSAGPTTPEVPKPEYLADPTRPMAGASAALFPEIYAAPGAAMQYGPGGWQLTPPTE
ncbi:hypothetical protein SE17_27045, partial [Kouleothrix aurantiaca]